MLKMCETLDEDLLSKCVISLLQLKMLLLMRFLSFVWLISGNQSKTQWHAKAKFAECNKIVKRIAFEKAISVEENKKSVVDSINVDSISTFYHVCYLVAALLLQWHTISRRILFKYKQKIVNSQDLLEL